MSLVLVVPDPHAPFTHIDALNFLQEVKENYGPDQVVCLGDLLDNHAVSDKYVSDPEGYSPGMELDACLKYFKKLSFFLPEMKICRGNHDERFLKAAQKAKLPASVLKPLKDLVNIPGWEFDDEFIIDDVLYIHGDGFGGATPHLQAMMKRMRSVVMGHAHTSFGVEYYATEDKLLFGAGAGCLMDRHSYAAAYGKKLTKKPILGCQLIDEGRTVITIPMILDCTHRWVGVL